MTTRERLLAEHQELPRHRARRRRNGAGRTMVGWGAISAAALVGAICLAGSVCAAGPRVRVIAHGWDTMSATPEDILRNASGFDSLPIDGTVISLAAKAADGTRFSDKTLPYDAKWNYEAFADKVPVLREIVKHRGLRHSLAGAWFNNTWGEKDVRRRHRWTDDAAWATFANNFGVLARIVREGGLDGICIDNEDYSKIRQYFWNESDGPFEEVRKLARRRGREVFSAAFAEKPDLKVMAFWFMSLPFGNYLNCDDPEASRREVGDLWPDFVNGMLDVMPPSAQFIDGNETTYYDRADRNDSYRKAKQLFREVLPLVEPENRVKYRGQLLAAPAHYLDSYVDIAAGEFYMPPVEGGTRLDRFVENFDQSVFAADGYLWLYGERHRFVNWQGFTPKRCKETTWNDALPGLYETVGCFRDAGRQGAQTYLRWQREGRVPENLAKNGACALAPELAGKGFLADRFPDGIESWKQDRTPGEFGTDTSFGRGDGFSLRMDRVQRGCLMQAMKVKPGERYVVRLCAKGQAAGFSVGYLTRGAQRVDVYSPRGAFRAPDADGWREGFAYAIVPRGADTLRVYLGGNRNETLWYDDICIYADTDSTNREVTK